MSIGVQVDEQLVQQVQLAAQPYIGWQLMQRKRCLGSLWMEATAQMHVMCVKFAHHVSWVQLCPCNMT